METFRLIALTACFLGIIITIFNSLYPSEKFGKQIKIMFSVIFILSLVKPIASGGFAFPALSETVSASSDYYESLSDGAYDYFIASVESSINASLENKLHEIDIYPEEIKTSINISDNGGISISEVKITLKDMTESFSAKKCVAEATGSSALITVKEYKYEDVG